MAGAVVGRGAIKLAASSIHNRTPALSAAFQRPLPVARQLP